MLGLGAAWLAGIFLGSLLAPAGDLTAPATLGSLVSLAVAILAWPHQRLRLIALCAVALLAGVFRYGTGLPVPGPDSVLHFAGGPSVVLQGRVDAEPVARDRWLELTVDVQRARPGGRDGAWEPASGRVQVQVSRYAAVSYGAALELEGKLVLPREDGRFSYREYLRRQGIYALMYRPKVRELPAEESLAPNTMALRGLHSLKARLAAALGAALPDPEAALAQGILLGNRAAMPQGLRDAFARTNTSHIVAISGFNIALVAGALLFLFQRLLGARWAFLPAVGGVMGYTVLVGAAPSVVRAAIMGGILILGRRLGRPGDTMVALLWAAGLMTALQPLLLWDVGFQLSFLATAGLIAVLPRLQARLSFLPAWIGEDLTTTLAAQIAVLPVLIVNFGQFSPLGILANLLVLPAFPPIMVLGGLAALGGALVPALGVLAGWLAWPFLAYMIRVVEFCAGQPGASTSLGFLEDAAPVLAWAYYAGLGLWLAAPMVRGEAPRPAALAEHSDAPSWAGTWVRWYAGAGAALLMLFWGIGVAGAPPAELRATVLDVGQGDAVLVRTPEGRTVLVDGGPSPAVLADALGRRLPFWRREIDLVILTHPHEDHLAGLIEVLERYTVRQVLDAPDDRPSLAHQRFRELARQQGAGYALTEVGQRVELGGGAALEVLHPPPGRCPDAHACSALLRLSDGEAALLLTGDLDPAAQRMLSVTDRAPASAVLKVPHHGAAGLDPAFLAAVAPEVAIVSVGAGNRFGHPAPATLDGLAGARLYRTDRDGSVEVVFTGGGYRVETAR